MPPQEFAEILSGLSLWAYSPHRIIRIVAPVYPVLILLVIMVSTPIPEFKSDDLVDRESLYPGCAWRILCFRIGVPHQPTFTAPSTH